MSLVSFKFHHLNTQNNHCMLFAGTRSTESVILFFCEYSDLAFCSEDKQTEFRMVLWIP